MAEVGQVAEITSKESSEKVNVRRLMGTFAACGAALLGISTISAAEVGGGVGVQIPDPVSGKSIAVGVNVSSTTGEFPLGTPQIPGKDYRDLKAFSVRIGNDMCTVYQANLVGENGETIKTLGMYPGFESHLYDTKTK